MKEIINREYLENNNYEDCLIEFENHYNKSYSLIDFARLKKISWENRKKVLFDSKKKLISKGLLRNLAFDYAFLVIDECKIPEVLDFFYYVEDIYKVHQDEKLVFSKKFHELYKRSFDASEKYGNFLAHRVVNALASRDAYEAIECISTANIDDEAKSKLLISHLKNSHEYKKGFKPDIVYMGICSKTGKNMHKYKGYFKSYLNASRAFEWKVDRGEVEIVEVNYAEMEIEKNQQKVNRLYKDFEKTSLKYKNQIKKLKEISSVKNLTH